MGKLMTPGRKTVEVYEMLKGGKPVAFDDILNVAGPNQVTAMTHICSLRNNFGADIETIRSGRKVEAYLLKNPSAVAKYMTVKPTATKPAKVAKAVVKTKPAKAKVSKVAVTKTKTTVSRTKVKDDQFDIPTLDRDLDISEVTDRELDDLKMQLGL